MYHIIRFYVFVVYRVESVFSKKKRSKIMKQIKIIDALKRSKFWLSYLNYKFVIEFKLLLIFEKSPSVYRFNVYIKNANVRFDKLFEIRFIITNQNKWCDFYYNEHLTRTCDQTILMKLSLKYLCSNVLLKERFLNV